MDDIIIKALPISLHLLSGCSGLRRLTLRCRRRRLGLSLGGTDGQRRLRRGCLDGGLRLRLRTSDDSLRLIRPSFGRRLRRQRLAHHRDRFCRPRLRRLGERRGERAAARGLRGCGRRTRGRCL